MKYEKWIVLPKATDSEIAELGLGGVESTLLVHRGIYTEDDLDEFLSPTLSSVHDPFLLPDMSNSVDRLIQAVDSNETVGVFGDFDTDGISGTALLTRGLENLGLKVFPYVPHRVDEGHGISPQSLEFFSSQGVTLLITVDCGVTSIDEIQTALDMGIETIVTDHHTALDGMPHAIGIVNPSLPNSSYPFKYLTGVGTAFKVMQALYLRKKIELPDELYVYVTLGTISDVGLMRDENRYLVSKGMDVLRKSEFVSIDALIKVSNASKKNLSTQDMSFGIIPRINVAGRLDHAKLSLMLLLSSDKSEADRIAEELNEMNKKRQILTEKAMQEAEKQIKGDFKDGVPAIIFAGKSSWIPGILGLIAGRLAEEYHRPAIVASGDGEMFRASARSIPEFNMIEALDLCSDSFERYGGHPMAAGFTIKKDKLRDFRKAMSSVADELLSGLDVEPELTIEAEISPSWINSDSLSFLNALEPYGEQNKEPIFMTSSMNVVDAKRVGASKNHLKLTMEHQGRIYDSIAFRQGDRIDQCKGLVDVAYKPEMNYWNGKYNLQFIVSDFRPA